VSFSCHCVAALTSQIVRHDLIIIVRVFGRGWTVWLERKIAARLYGPKHLDFEAIGGYASLQEAVKAMPPEFTSLVLPIEDGDPDEAYSVVAYERGFNFLLNLERKVGTKKFEAFFQEYIRHFGGGTLTSEDFREFFVRHFSADKKARAAIEDVDWNAWYYSTGMPPEVVEYDRSLAEASELLAHKWMEVDRGHASGLPLVNLDSWSTNQITCFLDVMVALTGSFQPLKISTLKAMNDLYGFMETRNSEILLRYCRLAISAEDESVLPVVVRFITTQGRMKFIRPLYKALYHSQMGRDIAVSTFLQHKDFYHPIGAKMVASDLMVKIESGVETAWEGSKDVLEEQQRSSGEASKDRNGPKVKLAIAVSAVIVVVAFTLTRRKR